jgi:hypothetical protein
MDKNGWTKMNGQKWMDKIDGQNGQKWTTFEIASSGSLLHLLGMAEDMLLLLQLDSQAPGQLIRGQRADLGDRFRRGFEPANVKNKVLVEVVAQRGDGRDPSDLRSRHFSGDK